jgi:hypothetical protein
LQEQVTMNAATPKNALILEEENVGKVLVIIVDSSSICLVVAVVTNPLLLWRPRLLSCVVGLI